MMKDLMTKVNRLEYYAVQFKEGRISQVEFRYKALNVLDGSDTR